MCFIRLLHTADGVSVRDVIVEAESDDRGDQLGLEISNVDAISQLRLRVDWKRESYSWCVGRFG